MKPVKFALAAGYTALRHTVGGGREIAIDAGGHHTTADPDEIATLDAHPAVKRTSVRAPASNKKRKPTAAAAPKPPATDEAAS
jgi:hypothetical protein